MHPTQSFESMSRNAKYNSCGGSTQISLGHRLTGNIASARRSGLPEGWVAENDER